MITLNQKKSAFLIFNLKHFPAVFHRFLLRKESQSVACGRRESQAGPSCFFSLYLVSASTARHLHHPSCSVSFGHRWRKRLVAAETLIQSAGPGPAKQTHRPVSLQQDLADGLRPTPRNPSAYCCWIDRDDFVTSNAPLGVVMLPAD